MPSSDGSEQLAPGLSRLANFRVSMTYSLVSIIGDDELQLMIDGYTTSLQVWNTRLFKRLPQRSVITIFIPLLVFHNSRLRSVARIPWASEAFRIDGSDVHDRRSAFRLNRQWDISNHPVWWELRMLSTCMIFLRDWSLRANLDVEQRSCFLFYETGGSFLGCCEAGINLVCSYLVNMVDVFLQLNCLTANLVLQDTVERIFVQNIYADIQRGIFLVRGENVLLLGEVVCHLRAIFLELDLRAQHLA